MRSASAIRREMGRLRRIQLASPTDSLEWAKATYALLALAWARGTRRGAKSAADHLLRLGALIAPARPPRPRRKASMATKNDEMTEEEISQVLEESVLDGSVERAGVNDAGEPVYRLTDEGKADVERMMRDAGVDVERMKTDPNYALEVMAAIVAAPTKGPRQCLVHYVEGWSCAPENPDTWWFPALGFSASEGHHVFDTKETATRKAEEWINAAEADLFRKRELLRG